MEESEILELLATRLSLEVEDTDREETELKLCLDGEKISSVVLQVNTLTS